MRRVTQSGFTLVEIALVLVIVGLLIGGVLKSQEMITNAKLKRIEKNQAGIMAAMFTYQDRYRQLPGDDESAKSRFTIYNDTINDPLPADINGNGDNRVDGDWVAVPNTETANFWKHLRAAGLIPGNGDDDSQLTNAFGGNIGIRDGSLLIAGHTMIFGSIEGSIIRVIESRFDDGMPNAGRIQSDLTEALMNGSAASTAGAVYLDNSRYFAAFRL